MHLVVCRRDVYRAATAGGVELGAALPPKLFRTEIFLVEAAEIGVRAVAIPCKLPCKGDPPGAERRSDSCKREVAASLQLSSGTMPTVTPAKSASGT